MVATQAARQSQASWQESAPQTPQKLVFFAIFFPRKFKVRPRISRVAQHVRSLPGRLRTDEAVWVSGTSNRRLTVKGIAVKRCRERLLRIVVICQTREAKDETGAGARSFRHRQGWWHTYFQMLVLNGP